ncbi:hypothetical protein GCM10027294_49390 [Marinactinospora endophytica]
MDAAGLLPDIGPEPNGPFRGSASGVGPSGRGVRGRGGLSSPGAAAPLREPGALPAALSRDAPDGDAAGTRSKAARCHGAGPAEGRPTVRGSRPGRSAAACPVLWKAGAAGSPTGTPLRAVDRRRTGGP